MGLGGMGSAAVAHLAMRGQQVLGLEQFGRLHKLGSSHGHTRIIREAYFEAPEYVPLVQRAYVLWRELEAATERDLLTITGGLTIGAPDSNFIEGSLESAKLHGLPYDLLDHQAAEARFPGLALGEGLMAVYEPNAGFLRPEDCVDAHLIVAERYGADVRFDTGPASWKADGEGVTVTAGDATFRADRLVIAAGPWSAEVIPDLSLPLEVERIVNIHVEPTQPDLYSADRFPVYLFQVPEGQYYGFPALPGQGVKIGRHEGGEITNAHDIRREVDDSEIATLLAALARYLPGAAGKVTSSLTCMYTNTPDENFIIDHHPGAEQVTIACGFSGHGYKFASAIGEVLADMAIDGQSRHDIDFLALSRFV
ncbi:MAG: N-methyl-L-tryptophan oxidase [Thermomicrobiales bacterium]|nr:N-methyl-L-tryptophan oxidase [Thermomicrobiales bacterium]